MSSPEIIAATLPWIADPAIALAACRAGAVGLVNLEHAAPQRGREALRRLAGAGVEGVGVKLDARSAGLVDELSRLPARSLELVVLVLGPDALMRDALARARRVARRVLVEVRSGNEAQRAEALSPDGLIAKGEEAGGWVGGETTFILVQRLLEASRLPVWAHGGIGLHSAAACVAGGAAGVVLEGALALARESPLDEHARRRVAMLDGSETWCLGERLERAFRFIAPSASAAEELSRCAAALERSSAPLEARQRDWEREVERAIAAGQVWPLGQDVAFADRLARRYSSVRDVAGAVRASIAGHLDAACRDLPLAAHAPLAKRVGTRYPIFQGPMTRVSDSPPFALQVAEAGGLPFLALALLRGGEARALLEETRALLGERTWGVGILGFVPDAIRREQLEALRVVRPPVALIAGGRPDQAAALAMEGTTAFLHVPSPSLLRAFYEQGARHFVFEGSECGGHVGPHSSLVLWDRTVETLLEVGAGVSEPCSAVFAGGIHDARSSAMVAALAAPLAARGIALGVLAGSAYLFTREAVTSGALSSSFQAEMIACERTVLLETGPGHRIRCAPTPHAAHFQRERERLLAEGRGADDVRDELEALNLGRLRLAAKGVAHAEAGAAGAAATAEQQHERGLYMAGQAAALHRTVGSIEELHRELSEGAGERLRRLPRRAGARPRTRAAGPLDLAIVGMGCLLPGARGPSELWSNIVGRVDAVTEVPRERFDWTRLYDPQPASRDRVVSKWGGFLEATAFDPLHHGVAPSSLHSIEPAQLLALVVAEAALADAGYLRRPFPRDRAAVIFGYSGGGDHALRYGLRAQLPWLGDDVARRLGELPPWTEDSLPGSIGNVVAGRVAHRFDLGGINLTVDAACASSLAAVHTAARELAVGECDLVIVGAADTCQNAASYLAFGATGALSPDGRCRPFDHRANGIAISEGVAAIVLKRREDAERDGDRIYAILKGIAGSSDGRALNITAPRAEGQVAALERAYRAAQLSPRTVGLVEAHGTGTVAGDQAEVEALRTVFERAGAPRQSCALGSIKSMIGHTKATAGLAGLIKAALALHHRTLPPTLHLERPAEALHLEESPLFPNVEATPWFQAPGAGPRRAAVSAFGFGGTNFHAILEEATRGGECEESAARWPVELLVLRAPSMAELSSRVGGLRVALDEGAAPTLAELASAAWSSSEGCAPGWATAALVVSSLADAKVKLAGLERRLGGGSAEALQEGVWLSTSSRPGGAGQVAFLFPGQGSQYVGMGRELAMRFREVRGAFEQADAVLSDSLRGALTARVFPPPAFDAAAQRAAAQALTATEVAQPAIGALSMGLARLVGALGVRPDRAAGHSYGEYVALTVAGALGESDLYALSHARGACLAEAAGGAGVGGMLAVEAPRAQLEEALGGIEEVWIAGHNAPRQVVLSGSAAGIAAAAKRLAAVGIGTGGLPVACAFHSPLVAAAREPFRAVLGRTPLAAPSLPVYSNVTAAPHPPDPTATAELLLEQLIRPVDFVGTLRAMHADGVRVFVEVGPGTALTGLVEQTLGEEGAVAVALDGDGHGLEPLLRALAVLAVKGVPLELGRLFEGRVERRARLDHIAEDCPRPVVAKGAWMVDGGRVHAPGGAPESVPELPIGAPSGDPLLARWQQSLDGMLSAQRELVRAYAARASGAPPAAPMTRAAVGGRARVGRPEILALLQRTAADRTGYPADRIGADLKLDADLGIGSLKRLEILSSAASALGLGPDVVRQATERLARIRTIGGLADAFLELTGARPERDSAAPFGPEPTLRATGEALARYLRTAVDAPAGKPTHRLDGAVLITDDEGGVAEAMAAMLRTTGALPIIVRHRPAGASARAHGADLMVDLGDATAVREAIAHIRSGHGPLGALFHLRPLRRVGSGGAEWRDTLGSDVKGLFLLLRYAALALAPQPAVIAASRRTDPARAPVDAAIAALVKSAGHEWPDARCKAVSVSGARSPREEAEVLLREALLNGSDAELCYEGSRRTALRAVPTPLIDEPAGPLLDPSSVVLVTGGGQGITAELAHELAVRYQPTLLVVGRSPGPDHLDAVSPASRYGRQRLRATLESLAQTGADVRYWSADVRQPDALARLLAEVYATYGRIDGVLHGAGVTEDALLGDKDPASFDRVFDTKVASALTLARHLRPETLRFLCFLSSTAGTFGNRGQADYAAANAFLDGLAASLDGQWPGRVVSLAWGPWDLETGIMSAEHASIFRARGVPLIDPVAGRQAAALELRGGPKGDAEVILARGLA